MLNIFVFLFIQNDGSSSEIIICINKIEQLLVHLSSDSKAGSQGKRLRTQEESSKTDKVNKKIRPRIYSNMLYTLAL